MKKCCVCYDSKVLVGKCSICDFVICVKCFLVHNHAHPLKHKKICGFWY